MYPFTVSQYNIYSSNVLTVKKFGSVYKAFHMRKKRISGFEKFERDKLVLSVKPNYCKSVIYPEKLISLSGLTDDCRPHQIFTIWRTGKKTGTLP